MSITDSSHMLFAVYIDSVYSLHFTGDIIHFQISMLCFAFLFFENKSRHATEKYVATFAWGSNAGFEKPGY